MTENFQSAFDAIADSPEDALNMKLRASMVREIRAKLKAEGWTQTRAATELGITQPRVSDLLNGKLSRFSLDALVKILAKLGSNVELRVA
jgi:predicted XRE-type DNA-binding protein